MYYNKEGKKIEMMEWTKLFEDFDYKIIKQENIGDKYWISTVWLGLDHRMLSKQGNPIIFETMVFTRKKTTWSKMGGKRRYFRKELDSQRHSTIEEAKKGHKKMVNKWSKK